MYLGMRFIGLQLMGKLKVTDHVYDSHICNLSNRDMIEHNLIGILGRGNFDDDRQ